MNAPLLRILLLLLSGTLVAQSQGTLSWSFDTTHFFVQPMEPITVTATVTNVTEVPFEIFGIGGNFGGDFQKTYNYTPLFSWDLVDKTLPAHGALQFRFGYLIPIGGTAALGTYNADPAQIAFYRAGGGEYLLSPQNTFNVTVVPEPSATSLFGLMAAVLFAKWMAARCHRTRCDQPSGGRM